MSRVRVFQLLVVLSVIVDIAWTLSWVIPFSLPPNVEGALRLNSYGELLPHSNLLMWGSNLILWMVSAVGLFFFQRWARTLYALLVAWSLVTFFTGGLLVQLPLQAGLGRVLSLLDGMILLFAYSPWATEAFNSTPNPTVDSDARKSGARGSP
jgi:hypothetical protein